MAKIKITKSAVDAAQPQAQPVELRDTLVPGFLCKITPAGRKVFIRHRSAADIANSGIPVKVGMMLTAHKTVAMFMRYVHTEDGPVRQAAELVANRRKTITGAKRIEEVVV